MDVGMGLIWCACHPVKVMGALAAVVIASALVVLRAVDDAADT